MNIRELVKQAIKRIDSMSIDELRAKFIEHGYVPANQKYHLSHPISISVRDNVYISSLNDTNGSFFSAYGVLKNHIHDYMSPIDFEHLPINEIAANQADYSAFNSCDLDLAA